MGAGHCVSTITPGAVPPNNPDALNNFPGEEVFQACNENIAATKLSVFFLVQIFQYGSFPRKV